jgi:hypothetical protein
MLTLKGCPIIEVNLSKGPSEQVSPPPHLRSRETDAVSKMLCFLVFRILDDGQSPETQQF